MAARKSQQNSAASVLDGYEPLEVIGSGTFGLIRKVRRISDGKIFARKELQFDRMTDRDRKQIVAEVNILRGLQHENIVKYEERFIDRENQILYIVMEYCEGGDLGSTIKRCRKTNTLLPEEMVWSYVSQMVLGLDACHYRGSTSNGSNSPAEEMAIPATAVLHRDLKPENVFLDGSQNIKIGDFGLSKEVAAQSFACTYVGTPYYMSPELATGAPYDIKADIWALGCVAFELCALAPPFDAQDQAELTRKIKLGHIPELPRGYSNDLGNLIRSMLDLNPKRRPTTKHLLKEHSIRLACRTMELSVLSKRISAEKNKLRAQYYELEMRERAISAREEEITVRQASSSRERDLDEREMLIREREATLQAKERELVDRERHLAEVQSRLDEKMKGRHSEDGYSRERSSSGHHTASSIARRPVTARRVSSGTVARVRASPSAELALDIVHVRPVMITPRSSKAEAVRQRFGRVSGLPALGSARSNDRQSRHRVDSNGSEEWEDNETEVEAETQTTIGAQDVTERASARRRQSCSTVSNQPLSTQSSEEGPDRCSARPRSTRKSISVMSPAVRNWMHEEDISMRDASAFIPSDDKENLQRYDESNWEKAQSLPVASTEETKSNRPALASRATIATGVVVTDALASPPIYDLSNDDDLPSPFLRKVTRQNNEILAKRVTKSGSGLVGPNNFLARAAAAGAARQIMTTAPKDQTETSESTVRKSVNRRLSTVNTASYIRKPAMTSSNSAVDVRSNDATQMAAPVIKRRSSAVPSSSNGLAALKNSSRKSVLIPPVPSLRQRAS